MPSRSPSTKAVKPPFWSARARASGRCVHRAPLGRITRSLTELLTKLSTIEAPEPERDVFGPGHRAAQITASAAALAAGTLPAVVLATSMLPSEKRFGLGQPAATIEVKLREKARPDDRDRSKDRTLTVQLGQPKGQGHVYLQDKGWPRIDRVDDSLMKLLDRPAFAFRGKEPLDFNPNDLTRIEIRPLALDKLGTTALGMLGGGTLIAGVRPALEKPLVLERSSEGWAIGAMGKADALKANGLADALSRLRVTAYVADDVSAAKLQSDYGLAAPLMHVRAELCRRQEAVAKNWTSVATATVGPGCTRGWVIRPMSSSCLTIW